MRGNSLSRSWLAPRAADLVCLTSSAPAVEKNLHTGGDYIYYERGTSAELPPISREPIELRDMAQAEIDNIEELIALLESSAAPLIEVAATPQEEDHMSCHPDLIGQLRGKIATMQAHWNEYDDPLDLFSGPEDERA